MIPTAKNTAGGYSMVTGGLVLSDEFNRLSAILT